MCALCYARSWWGGNGASVEIEAHGKSAPNVHSLEACQQSCLDNNDNADNKQCTAALFNWKSNDCYRKARRGPFEQ